LFALHTLVAWGKDIAKERKEVLAIPADERQKLDHFRIADIVANTADIIVMPLFMVLDCCSDGVMQCPPIAVCVGPLACYGLSLCRMCFCIRASSTC